MCKLGWEVSGRLFVFGVGTHGNEKVALSDAVTVPRVKYGLVSNAFFWTGPTSQVGTNLALLVLNQLDCDEEVSL